MKIAKRVIAMVLAVLMVLSIMPAMTKKAEAAKCTPPVALDLFYNRNEQVLINAGSINGNKRRYVYRLDLGIAYVYHDDISKIAQTNAGTYTVQYKSQTKGNVLWYDDGESTSNISVTIKKPKVATVNVNNTVFEADGSSHGPSIVSVISENNLTMNSNEYEISGTTSETKAGKYSFTVKGRGNFSSENPVTINWEITEKNYFNNDYLTLTGTSFNYSASEQGPSSIVLTNDKGTALTSNDYDLSGTLKATNAGTYTITATGKGEYAGCTASKTWTINKIDPVITGLELTYNGSDQNLVDLPQELIDSKAFHYKYGRTTISWNIGMPIEQEVTEKEIVYYTDATTNYNALAQQTYNRSVDASISNAKITGSISAASKAYTGGDITPEITNELVVKGNNPLTIKYSKTNSSKESDYSTTVPSFKEPGEHTIYYWAKAQYHDDLKDQFTFTITEVKEIESAKTTQTDNKYTYTGQPIVPVVEVYANGKKLDSQYYDLSGDLNKTNYGSYTITVTGKGDYSGSGATVNWSIEKLPNTATAPTAINRTYDKTEKALVNAGGTPLVGKMKYSLDNSTWSEAVPTAKNAATYTVYWKTDGDANHSPVSGSVPVTIEKASGADAIRAVKTTYNGKAQNMIKVEQELLDAGAFYYAEGFEWVQGVPTETDVGTNNYSYYSTETTNYTATNKRQLYTIYKTSTINPASITSVELNEASLLFNGKEQQPTVKTVKAGDLTLGTGAYKITSDAQSAVGTGYTFKVEANSNNFTGSATTTWAITEHNFFEDGHLTIKGSDGTYSKDSASYVYTGKKIELSAGDIKVTNDKGTALTKDQDYEIVTAQSQFFGTDAGTYTIKIVGKNDYAGDAATAIWKIAKATPNATVTPVDNYRYDAKRTTLIKSASTDFGKIEYRYVYKEPTDIIYNPSDWSDWSETKPSTEVAGGFKIQWRVSGTDNYNEKTGEFEVVITAADLAEDYVQLASTSGKDIVYDGSEHDINNEFILTIDGTKVPRYGLSDFLRKDIIAGGPGTTKATDAGTYTVYMTQGHEEIFEFKDITKEITKTWTIKPADMTDVSVSVTNSPAEYTGSDITPTVSASAKTVGTGNTAVFTYSAEAEGTYSENVPAFTEIGTHTIYYKVNAANHNEKTGSVTFTIEEGDLDDTTITVTGGPFTYTGKEIKPSVTVTNGAGNELTEETDYTVSYSDNINAGTATVTITAVDGGKYKGTDSENFTINSADITVSAAPSAEAQTYTGSALTPDVKGTFATVDKSTYTVTYSDSWNGTYSVSVPTFTTAGDHTVYYKVAATNHNTLAATEEGECCFTFTINNADITVKTAPSAAAQSYTGSALTPVVTKEFTTVGSKEYTVTYSDSWNGTYSASVPTFTAVGDHTIYYKVAAANHNTLAATKEGECCFTFTINNADITYTNPPTAEAQSYTGSALTPVVTEAFTTVDKSTYTVTYSTTWNGTYSASVPTFTAVGDHTIYYKVTAANHNTLEATKEGECRFTFTINKGDLPAENNYGITDAAPTFNNSAQTLVTSDFPEGVTPKYYVSDSNELTTAQLEALEDAKWTATPQKTNAGTYYVYYKIAGGDNYNDVAISENNRVTATIKKATLSGYTVTAEDALAYIADPTKTNQKLADVTGLPTFTSPVVSPSISYHVSDTKYDAAPDWKTLTWADTPKASNAGTYYVYYKIAGGTNYEDVEPALGNEVDAEISKSDLSYTVSAVSDTLTYSREAQTLAGVSTLPSFSDPLVSPSISYYVTTEKLEKEPDWTTITNWVETPEGTDADTYYIYHKIAGGTNYNDVAPTYASVAEKAIAPKALEDNYIKFTDSINSFKYNGLEFTPSVYLLWGEYTLDSSSEYEFDGTSENTKTAPGTYTIKVNGKGNYTGSASTTWTITNGDVSTDCEVTLDQTSFVYDGAAKTPVVKITNTESKVELTAGTDYELSGDTSMTDAGDYTITITGKGNYAGESSTTTADWSITKRDITDKVSEKYVIEIADIDDQTYTGAGITPTLTVTNKILSETGTAMSLTNDYTVEYSKNTDVTSVGNEATATIEGTGNYQGTRVVTFNILPKDISGTDTTISYTGDSLTYTGNQQSLDTSKLSLSNSGITGDITFDTTGTVNGTNANTYTATITGTGNFTGSKSYEWTISPCDISTTSILSFPTLDAVDYTGSEITPSVTIKNTAVEGNPELEEGDSKDYTLEYKNNTNAGSATVTVTGYGNYTGTKDLNFTINALSIADAIVGDTNALVYTGEKLTLDTSKIVLTVGTLSATFTVTGDSGTNADTYTANFAGTGNFTGSKSYEWKIAQRDITGETKIEIAAIDDQTYTGLELKPDLTVTNKLGASDLAMNLTSDYTAKYASNINKGTATVTITGNGNYKGTKEATFEIDPRDIADKVSENYVITISGIEGKTYTGNELTQGDLAVTNTLTGGKGTALVKGSDKDFTVAYENNINATTEESKASLTITGRGNYTGSRTEYFEIAKASMTGVSAEDTVSQTFKGTDLTPNPETAATTVDGKTAKFTYSASWNGEYKETLPTFVNAGSHKVYYKVECANHTTVAATKAEECYFTFTIEQRDLADEKIVVGSIQDQVYTGSEITPEVTVTNKLNTNDIVLTQGEGKDVTVSYSDNEVVGTATVTITANADGNYKNETSTTFKITNASMTDVSVSAANQTYTGNELTPVVTENATTVGDNEAVFTYSTSQSGKYEETVPTFTDAKTYTIYYKVNAANHKEESGSFSFTVDPLDIDAALTASKLSMKAITDPTYDGKEQKPEVELSNKQTTPETALVLGSDKDFTVTYENNTKESTEASKASLTITGHGNYTGTKKVEFLIKPATIANITIEADAQTYTGSDLTPVVQKTAESVDKTTPKFTYSASWNGEYKEALPTFVNAGSHKVYYKVECANHTTVAATKADECYFTFTIEQRDLADEKIVVGSIQDQVYTGSEITPEVTVTNKLNKEDIVLTQGEGKDVTVSYSDNTVVGTATVTITANENGNYKGSTSTTFKITNASMTDVSVSAANQTYTGNELTPAVTENATTVGDNEAVFTYSTSQSGEYDETVPTFTDAKTYTIYYKVNAANHKEESGSFSFTVDPLDIDAALTASKLSMKAITDPTYDGKEQKPEVELSNKQTTPETALVLGSDKDFTVTYENNTKESTEASKASLTITGHGNYTGTKKVEFLIKPATITNITIEADAQTYTGSDLTPVVQKTAESVDKTTPKFTYSASWNGEYKEALPTFVNAGSHKVYYKVECANHTTVAATKAEECYFTFTIEQRDLADEKIFITPIASQVYTGSEITPEVTVTNKLNKDDIVLTQGTGKDVTVEMESNVIVGTATVTVTANENGNYKGSTGTTFFIINADLEDVSVTAAEQTYSAIALKPEVTEEAVTVDDSDVIFLYSATGEAGSYKKEVPTFTNAGTHTIYYRALADNHNQKDGSFTFLIEPRALTDNAVIHLGDALQYNGKKQIQKVQSVVFTDGKQYTLTADDFDLSGNQAVEAGSYKLTLNAKGNYSGSLEKSWVIVDKEVDVDKLKGDVKIDVKQDKDIPATEPADNKAELVKSIATADDLSAVAEGATLDIWMEITNIEETITPASKSEIKKAAGERTVLAFIDISLYKKLSTDNEATKVELTNEPITITIKLTDDMLNTDPGMERQFSIAQNHEGVVTLIPATIDEANKTLTFVADQFSDYALTYVDVAKNTTPRTGDFNMTGLYLMLSVLSIAALAGFGLRLRKKQQ